MGNGNTEDWLVKLQDALTDLKITTSSVETKIDQLKEGVSKLEDTIEILVNSSSQHDVRISLLEQKHSTLPVSLAEDVVILKSQAKAYQRILTIISTGLLGVLLEMVLRNI